MVKFCSCCKKATEHRELEQAGIAVQLVVALITRFKANLREHECECNECGKRS